MHAAFPTHYSPRMAWDISVAGTVHLNDITTPHGRRQRIHGGSAVYFALAASRFAPVHFHGIVGRDAETEFRDLLTGPPIDLSGLSMSDSPTFLWRAEHDYSAWVAREQPSPPGCDSEWQPTLGAAGAAAPVLFLGSMDPHIQSHLLAQSSARLVGSDSMTNWIRPDHDAVEAVAEASDVLFLNRTEMAALTPDADRDWRSGAASLLGRGRLRAVVVKAGPDGAAVVTQSGVIEKPAASVTVVMDPTGAGDSLAGGFLGACARAERDDDAFFAEALDEGLRCAAAAISRFGTEGLRSHSPV